MDCDRTFGPDCFRSAGEWRRAPSHGFAGDSTVEENALGFVKDLLRGDTPMKKQRGGDPWRKCGPPGPGGHAVQERVFFFCQKVVQATFWCGLASTPKGEIFGQ